MDEKKKQAPIPLPSFDDNEEWVQDYSANLEQNHHSFEVLQATLIISASCGTR